MCTYSICYLKYGKLFRNFHFSRIMFIVFGPFKHLKLPISIKLPVTLPQIGYICLTAIRVLMYFQIQFHLLFSNLLVARLYRACPGSEFVVANTLAKWKKLEPNEINFSLGFSHQQVVLYLTLYLLCLLLTFANSFDPDQA